MPPLLSRSERSLRLEFGPLDDHSDAKRQHWELEERQVNGAWIVFPLNFLPANFPPWPATRGCYANEAAREMTRQKIFEYHPLRNRRGRASRTNRFGDEVRRRISVIDEQEDVTFLHSLLSYLFYLFSTTSKNIPLHLVSMMKEGANTLSKIPYHLYLITNR